MVRINHPSRRLRRQVVLPVTLIERGSGEVPPQRRAKVIRLAGGR
jgi:hypothetical protein